MCLFRLKPNRWFDGIMMVIYVPPNSNCPAGLRLLGCIKLLIDKPNRIVLYIVHAPLTSLLNVSDKSLVRAKSTIDSVLCSRFAGEGPRNVYTFSYEYFAMDTFSAKRLILSCSVLF